MKLYLDSKNGLLLTVIDGKGVAVNASVARAGMMFGFHEKIINEMLGNPETNILSDAPLVTDMADHPYKGLTLDEVTSQLEEITE